MFNSIISYDFNLDRMTSFEGDTGAYLQYTHVRLCSLQRNATIQLRNSRSLIDTSLLTESKAHELVMLLSTFPDVVRNCLKGYEPSTLVTYSFSLAHLVSSALAWDVLAVRGKEEELAQARLYLFECARDVLGSAMRLLSLLPLERM